MSFLEKIVLTTEQRINNLKLGVDFPYEKALKGEEISFICEVKKASPSKGIIAEHFPYLDIAREYEQAGATAISVLTEPQYFMGCGEYLKEINCAVEVPTLCKDFIIDPLQIYEAKVWGASAVLLIAEILNENKLANFIEIANNIGLSAHVESHSLPMLEKSLRAGAKIVGINNRNLDTFEVDINTSIRLRKYVPRDVIFVAESGISTADDVKKLRENGVNAVLIGETLMRSKNKKAMLEQLRGNV
ncbi:MAG: indole-3-glycerol phosphate synthase TrpC [Eubacteriaceae bacterium]